jgi:hypothetical protein
MMFDHTILKYKKIQINNLGATDKWYLKNNILWLQVTVLYDDIIDGQDNRAEQNLTAVTTLNWR